MLETDHKKRRTTVSWNYSRNPLLLQAVRLFAHDVMEHAERHSEEMREIPVVLYVVCTGSSFSVSGLLWLAVLQCANVQYTYAR